jgi:hypothetical protein
VRRSRRCDHRLDQVGDRVVPDVTQRDRGLDGFQRDPQPHGVARAFRRSSERRGTGRDGARVRRSAPHRLRSGCPSPTPTRAASRCGRRPTRYRAGDGPAEGDRLQLRNHQRGQPVRQGGRNEILVGAHPATSAVPAPDPPRSPRSTPTCPGRERRSSPGPGTGWRSASPAAPRPSPESSGSSPATARHLRRELHVRHPQEHPHRHAKPRQRDQARSPSRHVNSARGVRLRRT